MMTFNSAKSNLKIPTILRPPESIASDFGFGLQNKRPLSGTFFYLFTLPSKKLVVQSDRKWPLLTLYFTSYRYFNFTFINIFFVLEETQPFFHLYSFTIVPVVSKKSLPTHFTISSNVTSVSTHKASALPHTGYALIFSIASPYERSLVCLDTNSKTDAKP